MAAVGGLTAEQKRRIEENRRKALLLRSQRNQGNKPNSTSWHTTAGLTTAVAHAPLRSNHGNKADFASSKQSKDSSYSATSSFIDSSKPPQTSIITKPGGFCVSDASGKSSLSGNQIQASSVRISSRPTEPASVQCLNRPTSQTTRSETGLKSAPAVTDKLPVPATSGAKPPTEGSFQGHHQPSSHPSSCVSKPKTITSFYSAKPKPSSGTQASCFGRSDSVVSHSNARKSTFGFPVRSDNQAHKVKQPDFSLRGGAAKPTFGGGAKPTFGGGAKPTFGGGQGSALSGTCALLSRSRFVVNIGYHAKLIEIFKAIPSKAYDTGERKWSFALSDYDTLMEAVKPLRPSVEIEPLPKAVCAAFRRQRHGGVGERTIAEANLKSVDEKLVNTLMTFQREGVNFAVSREGRVLIADDMGLGKTLQAICIACYYRTEWPVLIVSPSSVRYTWAEAFEKWVPSLDPDDINVVVNSKGCGTSGQVNILSYDLMHRKAEELKKFHFQVVIMDECHFLKNVKTARTKAALPILKAAPRVMLLSGTPALSRPSELYTQIVGVAPRLFPSFHEFGFRYCNATQNPWGWDYSGSSNMTELQLLLEECIMIRRLKQDVLKELPAKTRQMVIMDPSVVKTNSKSLKSVAKEMDQNKSKSGERGILLKYFAETGLVKVPAIRDYVLDLLEAGHKFLIFAHHQSVLDALSDAISQKKYDYIRIDGSSTAKQRKACCDRFQQEETCRAAVLSITAANAGLTLTAASMVVFAELFWNPGILVQAEDRVHRIGQENATNIRYLIAKGTADDYIWPLVQKKLAVLGKAGLSKDDFSEADTTTLKDPRQKSILSFFEKSFLEDDEESEQEDLACLVAMESQDELSNTDNPSHGDIAGDDILTEERQTARHTCSTEKPEAVKKSTNRDGALTATSQTTQSKPSVIPSNKSKALFSTPWVVKKPLTEANGHRIEDCMKAPPPKRQKNVHS